MKGKDSIKIFGKETLPQIPQTSSYFELKHNSINFIMGQFYPQLIVFILGVISFILTLMLTIFVNFCCIPKKSSPAGWFIIFWWIFFSLFYVVGIVYFFLGILKAPSFIDDYPKIIDIVGDASMEIKKSYSQFVNNYFNLSSYFFSKNIGSFGSLAVLLSDESNDNTIWQTDNLSKMMHEYLTSISSNISEIYNNIKISQKCDIIDIRSLQTVNLSSAYMIIDSLNNMTESLIAIDDCNSKAIQSYGKDLRDILSIYINIPSKEPFINFSLILDNYFDIEVQKAIPSFNTDNNYYKAMRYLIYIIFCLLVLYYIFQTIAFSMSNFYSRCCVIASQPISLIISIVVGIIGIVTTSISCSISDLCIESNEFAANFYSGKIDFVSLGLTKIDKELVFNSENNYIYDVLNLSNVVNFYQSNSEIRAKLETINLTISNTTFLEKLNHSNYELKSSLFQEYLINNVSFLINSTSNIRRQMISSKCVSDSEIYYVDSIFRNANLLLMILKNDIPLITKASDSFLIYDDANSKKLFISSFSSEDYLDIAKNSSSLTTSLFTCPLRNSKKIFCEETGGTFSYFAIFAHFYLVSLIGFSLLLLFRRKNMLSSYEIKDLETNNQNNDKKKTVSQFISDDSSQMIVNSSSDSSFDMFQQSRTSV